MTSEVISGREEWESWMNALVLEADEGSIVIDLHGIGGIGKTSLLQKWYKADNCDSLIVDFGSEIGRVDLSSRVSQFVQRLRLLGHDFPVFDYLWIIRSVVIEEKKPDSLDVFEKSGFVRTLGDSLKRHLIPFHEDLEEFFRLMRERWNRSQYSSKGQWLTNNLGENWEEEWLNLIIGPSTKIDSWLNILYQAILYDFNESYSTDNQTTLILIDRFDDIHEAIETEFWCNLLLGMKKTVSIIVGRTPLKDEICAAVPRVSPDSFGVDSFKSEGIKILELDTLDARGSRNLVNQTGISNKEIVDVICRIGKGHPDLLRLMCDSVLKGATIEDIESIESSKMKEVRQRALDVLLRKAGAYIRNFLDLAALTPYFDKSIIFRMDDSLNDSFWREMLNLSFIRESMTHGKYHEMHEVVRRLLLMNWKSDTEIRQLKRDRMIKELNENFESTRDIMYIALVLTISGSLDEEEVAEEELRKIRVRLMDKGLFEQGLQATSYPDYQTKKLKLMQMFAQGEFYKALGRLYQSIEILRNAMNLASAKQGWQKDAALVVECLRAGEENANSYWLLGNHEMALRIYENLVRYYGKVSDHFLASWYWRLGQLHSRFEHFETAYDYLLKSQKLCETTPETDSILAGVWDAFGALYTQREV